MQVNSTKNKNKPKSQQKIKKNTSVNNCSKYLKDRRNFEKNIFMDHRPLRFRTYRLLLSLLLLYKQALTDLPSAKRDISLRASESLYLMFEASKRELLKEQRQCCVIDPTYIWGFREKRYCAMSHPEGKKMNKKKNFENWLIIRNHEKME